MYYHESPLTTNYECEMLGTAASRYLLLKLLNEINRFLTCVLLLSIFRVYLLLLELQCMIVMVIYLVVFYIVPVISASGLILFFWKVILCFVHLIFASTGCMQRLSSCEASMCQVSFCF